MRLRKEGVRPVGRTFVRRRLVVAVGTLFAAATAIGMIMTVAPAVAAASPARVTQAITHGSNAHIHALVQPDKTATAAVASCATAHTCFQIQSWGHPGFCLNAVASGVHNNGDKVQAWGCNWTGTNQLWEDGSCDFDGILAWCQIKNAADTSKCLDANINGGLRDDSTAQLWSCNGGGNQLWSFSTPDQPCFSINSFNPAFACLQTENGNSNGSGFIIQTEPPWSGNGDQAEMWSAAQETRPADIGWGNFLHTP
jgi:hypothetical protein